MILKQSVFAAALLLGGSGLAFAQSTAPSTAPGNPPAAQTVPQSGTSSNPNAASTRSGDTGLQPGANSFTEGQARGRIEDHGYTDVKQLHKDQNSIWQAEAMKDGRRVRVGLDFRGNVAEEK